jgi:hypothetical protein
MNSAADKILDCSLRMHLKFSPSVLWNPDSEHLTILGFTLALGATQIQVVIRQHLQERASPSRSV